MATVELTAENFDALTGDGLVRCRRRRWSSWSPRPVSWTWTTSAPASPNAVSPPQPQAREAGPGIVKSRAARLARDAVLQRRDCTQAWPAFGALAGHPAGSCAAGRHGEAAVSPPGSVSCPPPATIR